MELIQIVPTLPPSLSGVGDYAALLANELRDAHGVETRFIVGDPAWRGHGCVPFPAEAIDQRTARALLARLQSAAKPGTPILLHYVGYGYARRGCPFWLATALAAWKRQTSARPDAPDAPVIPGAPGAPDAMNAPGIQGAPGAIGPAPLIVLFHELHADGPVWSSAFWTGPFQKWLGGRLARLADYRRMTTEVAAGILREMLHLQPGDAGRLAVTPVFSTLGEPPAPPPLTSRRRQMIVFGSRGWRAQVYTIHLAAFAEACTRLGIERVVDVGAPLDITPALPVPFEAAGPLAAHEASALFANSLAGYFTYPVPFLAKSTIFAAYCACGLVPVTTPSNAAPNPDGLVAGKHYLLGIDDSSVDTARLEATANAAQTWYRGHRLAVHAAGIYEQCQGL